MLKLSVIIPTFNRQQVLERTLPALSAQDLPPEDYEVIVVMDGATDGTAELLRSWKPKCAFCALEAPHRGAGAARNVGIQAAVGELVLFLDDDLIAVPDLLRQHYASHSGSDLSVVHGPIYVAPGSSQTIIRHVMERFYENYHGHLNPAMDLHFPEGLPSSVGALSSLANSSVPRDVLLRSGGFDERILAAEDLELGLRLWKMGMSFHYQPAAVAYEFYVKSSRQYLQQQAKALGTGDLIAGRKHPEYRPHSRLSVFAETPAPKRWLRSALLRLPVSPVPLLALPLRLEKWFYSFSPMRRVGAHLLLFAETVARLRGAVSTAGTLKDLESEFDRRAPALVYHHVGPRCPGAYRKMTVSPEQFEQQMRRLAQRGYVGIRPSDWLRWLREGTGLPEKPILLTFDDAYADTAHYALPILRRYGFSAAVFVVTGRMGGTNTWDEAQGCGTLQLMTAEQIRTGPDKESSLGTQPDACRFHETTAAELPAEVVGSKNELSALLGSSVVSFAYPYGKYNDAICDLVRNEFDLAFSVEEGINYLRGDPHLLRRAYVGPDDSLF